MDFFISQFDQARQNFTKTSDLLLFDNNVGGEQRKARMRDLERFFEAADSQVREMKSIAQRSDADRLRACEADLQKMRNQLKQTKASADPFRAQLGLDTGSSENDRLAASQRERLLQVKDRLDQGSGMIKESQRELANTEQIGVDTLRTLQQQRQKLLHVKTDLDDTDASLAQGGKSLGRIQTRALVNKLIMALLVLILLAAIGFVLWLKFKPSGNSGGGTNSTRTDEHSMMPLTLLDPTATPTPTPTSAPSSILPAPPLLLHPHSLAGGKPALSTVLPRAAHALESSPSS